MKNHKCLSAAVDRKNEDAKMEAALDRKYGWKHSAQKKLAERLLMVRRAREEARLAGVSPMGELAVRADTRASAVVRTCPTCGQTVRLDPGAFLPRCVNQ